MGVMRMHKRQTNRGYALQFHRMPAECPQYFVFYILTAAPAQQSVNFASYKTMPMCGFRESHNNLSIKARAEYEKPIASTVALDGFICRCIYRIVIIHYRQNIAQETHHYFFFIFA